MNEVLTPRIYREYCWFALLLLVLTIGFVGRPPLAQTGTPLEASEGPASAVSTPPAHHPP